MTKSVCQVRDNRLRELPTQAAHRSLRSRQQCILRAVLLNEGVGGAVNVEGRGYGGSLFSNVTLSSGRTCRAV